MKQLIRSITPPKFRNFLIRLGKFYAKEPFPSQEATLHTLKSLGWKPKSSIDVGAYHGDWAKMVLNIFPSTEILMIEGQAQKEQKLIDAVSAFPSHLEYEISLLGATDNTEVEFTEMETGSSVYEESSPYQRIKKTCKLKRLDTLLESQTKFKNAQFLKLDTQGYELQVLKGAEGLLDSVEVILLEASLIPINQSAPLISEVVNYLSAREFKLFDFCSQIRRNDGVLWQTDLMFIRDGAIPNLKAELTRENWG